MKNTTGTEKNPMGDIDLNEVDGLYMRGEKGSRWARVGIDSQERHRRDEKTSQPE